MHFLIPLCNQIRSWFLEWSSFSLFKMPVFVISSSCYDNFEFINRWELVTPYLNNRSTLWWLSHHSKNERTICSDWYYNIFTRVYSAILILQTTLIWQILLHHSNTKWAHQTLEKSISPKHNFRLAKLRMLEFDKGIKWTPNLNSFIIWYFIWRFLFCLWISLSFLLI